MKGGFQPILVIQFLSTTQHTQPGRHEEGWRALTFLFVFILSRVPSISVFPFGCVFSFYSSSLVPSVCGFMLPPSLFPELALKNHLILFYEPAGEDVSCQYSFQNWRHPVMLYHAITHNELAARSQRSRMYLLEKYCKSALSLQRNIVCQMSSSQCGRCSVAGTPRWFFLAWPGSPLGCLRLVPGSFPLYHMLAVHANKFVRWHWVLFTIRPLPQSPSPVGTLLYLKMPRLMSWITCSKRGVYVYIYSAHFIIR